MADYWVSKDRYWCKYCKVFIADDAPSRNHHESGLKHKGNYERFIRNLYKQGEKERKDAREEATEIERINRAAHASLGLQHTPSVATTARERPAKKSGSSGGVWDNYSTAEQLGLVDAEQLEHAQAKSNEVKIGQWERVTPRDRPATPSAASVEDEEERPTTKKYLKEKTARLADDDDGYDPSKIAFKLKKKAKREGSPLLPKEEEEEAAPQEERGPAFKKDGWATVELKDEPEDALPSFEELTEANKAARVKEEEEQKPALDGNPVPTSNPTAPAFKKRKMHGAAAVRKK